MNRLASTESFRPKRPDTELRWRSRMVVLAVMCSALSIYVGGLYWFGQALADDMRAGIRDVKPGVLIVETDR